MYTNKDRAESAKAAISTFSCEVSSLGSEAYDEPEVILSDLLASLMHYAAAERIDINIAYQNAQANYLTEVSEEADRLIQTTLKSKR